MARSTGIFLSCSSTFLTVNYNISLIVLKWRGISRFGEHFRHFVMVSRPIKYNNYFILFIFI